MSQTVNKSSTISQRTLLIGIVVAAIAVAAVLIVVSSGSGLAGSGIDYAALPQFRTADGGFVLGSPEAPVTLVVFEDFRCPHCQTYETELEQFVKEYVAKGKAQLEFRMMMSTSRSPLMFQLLQCAEEIKPNSFWKGREQLFTMARRGFNDATSPREFAASLGIDYNKVLDCVPNARQFVTDQNVAISTGVSGTPTVLVRYNGGTLQNPPVQLGPRPSIAQIRSFMAQFE